MRVSCACPVQTASCYLFDGLRKLGVQPIITSQVVRAVYEGSEVQKGEAIVRLFEREIGNDINAQYSKEELSRQERRAVRKQERAEQNTRLHRR